VLDIWQSKSRRSNVQIMAEMLRVSYLRQVGKAELSSSVNINYSQMQKYLNRLLRLGLLDAEVKESRQINYRITEKGKNLLNNIDSVQELIHRNKPLVS
jgi:predicted transcriptional regulator